MPFCVKGPFPVSNLSVNQVPSFRRVLPIVQTAAAAVFGGWGLWQRTAILSRSFLGGTLWDTTATFHVWPWPYKFAAVVNMPSLLAGSLLSVPLESLLPGIPQIVVLAPSLPLVYLLWYWVGRRLDRRWSTADRAPWIGLAAFTALCLGGAFIHGRHDHTVYIPFGEAIWMMIIPLLFLATKAYCTAEEQESPLPS